MALDEFEKELFNGLNDFQSPLNLDQEWQEIEERLPRKKKRRLFIWWLPSVAGIILTVAILFYNNNNKNTKTPIPTETSKTTLLLTKEILEKNATIDISEKTFFPRINKSTSNKSTSNVFKSIDQLKPSGQLSISENQPSNSNSITVPQKLKTSFSKKNQTIGIKKKNNLLKNNNALTEISFTKSYLEIIDLKLEIPNTYFINDTPIVEYKIQPKWSSSFGVTYGTNQLNRKSNIIEIQDQIDFLSDYEEQVDYLSIQLKTYRNLNKNFSLFSGIIITQHSSIFKLGESFEVERNAPPTLLEKHYLLTGLIENIYGAGSTKFDITVQSKLWQKYQSIGFPIGISVHNNLDKRWSFQNDFAFVIHPFQKMEGKKVLKSATDYSVFNNNTYSTKVFRSLSNQFTLNWKMNKHFILQISTDLGIDLDSRLNTNLQYDLRFANFGIGLGGKFLF